MSGTPFVDVRDEYEDVDTFHVGNKDPNYYYCWVNKKPENMERRKLEGYEVVTAKDGENALTRPNPVGERVIGDLVLMRMPRERHDRLQKRRAEQNDRQLAAANDAAREQIEKAGFEVEDTTVIQKKQGVFGAD